MPNFSFNLQFGLFCFYSIFLFLSCLSFISLHFPLSLFFISSLDNFSSQWLHKLVFLTSSHRFQPYSLLRRLSITSSVCDSSSLHIHPSIMCFLSGRLWIFPGVVSPVQTSQSHCRGLIPRWCHPAGRSQLCFCRRKSQNEVTAVTVCGKTCLRGSQDMCGEVIPPCVCVCVCVCCNLKQRLGFFSSQRQFWFRLI